jgi:hypothetical protein
MLISLEARVARASSHYYFEAQGSSFSSLMLLLVWRLELLKPHIFLFEGSRIKLPMFDGIMLVGATQQKIKNKANLHDEPYSSSQKFFLTGGKKCYGYPRILEFQVKNGIFRGAPSGC